jgi:hypothetical protein
MRAQAATIAGSSGKGSVRDGMTTASRGNDPEAVLHSAGKLGQRLRVADPDLTTRPRPASSRSTSPSARCPGACSSRRPTRTPLQARSLPIRDRWAFTRPPRPRADPEVILITDGVSSLLSAQTPDPLPAWMRSFRWLSRAHLSLMSSDSRLRLSDCSRISVGVIQMPRLRRQHRPGAVHILTIGSKHGRCRR